MDLNVLVRVMKAFCRVINYFYPDSLAILAHVLLIPLQNWTSTIESNVTPDRLTQA